MSRFAILTICLGLFLTPAFCRQSPNPAIYVLLWFDTEDYLLPASDDAALRLSRFLTERGIRATFKVVGEKARVLEKRGRTDVLSALAQHEIGYHTNFHSSPESYLVTLAGACTSPGARPVPGGAGSIPARDPVLGRAGPE